MNEAPAPRLAWPALAPEAAYQALALSVLRAAKAGVAALTLDLPPDAPAPWVARLLLAARRLGLTLDPNEAQAPPRSNSFVYTKEEALTPFTPDACPYRTGKAILHAPQRAFLLRNDDEVALYRTASRDFSDEEIWQLLREKGQIYLDRSHAALHGDFAADFAATTLCEGCKSCERLPLCPGLHAISDENRFHRAEALVHTEIEALGGRLLDVGGGGLPYVALYRAALAQGRLRHITLIEPAPTAAMLAFAEEQGERVRLLPVPLESAPPPETRYDAILVLRSHNHLPRPFAAYARLSSWLAKGGKLVVADNLAYGVLRAREDFERAKSATQAQPFEHFRNDDLSAALVYLSALPLRLVSRHDVHPQTANQWLAVLDKANA